MTAIGPFLSTQGSAQSWSPPHFALLTTPLGKPDTWGFPVLAQFHYTDPFHIQPATFHSFALEKEDFGVQKQAHFQPRVVLVLSTGLNFRFGNFKIPFSTTN